ncbi:hypothetical protein F2Q69_00002177 [Brassica cretica]|uniref:Glycosyl transferase 48 domain-containing protein n=1 Tax=Brassica cretica TaxID=69181 RepID=A0A8S9NX39_BRACR|nr:hypothetical protein F2Q69_00002177 [Brassica cretica]
MYPFDRWRLANDFGSCAFSLYSRNLHVGLGSTFTGCTHSSKKEILRLVTPNQLAALEQALATQSIFQLWFLMVLPMVMEIGLEEGFRSVFFTFQLGTKSHYYGRTILHGGSKYRPTGRGFVVFHAKFAENYIFYSRNKVKGLDLLLLLIVYNGIYVVHGWLLVVCTVHIQSFMV